MKQVQENTKKEKEEKKEKVKKVVLNPRTIVDNNCLKAKDTKKRMEIVKMRNKGFSWEKISNHIGYSVKKVQDIYNQEIALGIITNKPTANSFSHYAKQMEKRYGEIVETMDRLHNLAKKSIEDFESEDMSDMRTYIKFMKSAPIIIQIVREIKDQIAFLKEEQEKIKIEQKNYIYSPMQINKYLNTTLTYLHKNDYIKILKKLPFDK